MCPRARFCASPPLNSCMIEALRFAGEGMRVFVCFSSSGRCWVRIASNLPVLGVCRSVLDALLALDFML